MAVRTVISTSAVTASSVTALKRHGSQQALSRTVVEYSYSVMIGTRRLIAVKLIWSLYSVSITNMMTSSMNMLTWTSRSVNTTTMSIVLAVIVRGTPCLAPPPTPVRVLLVLIRSRLPRLTTPNCSCKLTALRRPRSYYSELDEVTAIRCAWPNDPATKARFLRLFLVRL